MILEPKQARAAVAGRATQARLPVVGDRPCPVKVGRDYPVRTGHRRASIGRVRVLQVRDEPLGAITYADARAEGHKTTIAAKAAWVAYHDHNWYLDHIADDDMELAARFDRQHAHKLVHVVTFTVAPDKPLLLATQGSILAGYCEPGGYTTNRAKAIDDLEVIPPAARYVEHASIEGARVRAARLEDQTAARRARKKARDRQRVAQWRTAM